jgi:hypothetical protein
MAPAVRVLERVAALAEATSVTVRESVIVVFSSELSFTQAAPRQRFITRTGTLGR